MTSLTIDQILSRARRQRDDSVHWARTRMLPWVGASMREFPTPMPATWNAIYAGGESAGRREVITGYPEAGRWQATCRKHGDDECGDSNFDPFDSRASAWGVQRCWWVARRYAEKHLRTVLGGKLDRLAPKDHIVLLYLVRSIGPRAMMNAVVQAVRFAPRKNVVLEDLSNWMFYAARSAVADYRPWCGQQDPEIVRLRVMRACLQVEVGTLAVGEVVALDEPPCRRPSDLRPCPRDIYTNLKGLAAIARRQGQQPTGPWETT